jgi:uncharacterized membrane protein (DUF373 family)
MHRYLDPIQKLVIVVLIVMMMVIILLSTYELGYMIVKDIVTPPVLMLEIDELLELFGFFLLVLIGIELLETIRTYIRESVIHVQEVFIVALIAIARKVIILDVKKLSSLTLIGIASIIVALSLGYFLIFRTGRGKGDERLGMDTLLE